MDWQWLESRVQRSLLVHSSDFQSHVVLHERDDLAHSEYSFGRNVSTLKQLLATQKSNEKAVEKCRR